MVKMIYQVSGWDGDTFAYTSKERALKELERRAGLAQIEQFLLNGLRMKERYISSMKVVSISSEMISYILLWKLFHCMNE